jgi:hypothetical protein
MRTGDHPAGIGSFPARLVVRAPKESDYRKRGTASVVASTWTTGSNYQKKLGQSDWGSRGQRETVPRGIADARAEGKEVVARTGIEPVFQP